VTSWQRHAAAIAVILLFWFMVGGAATLALASIDPGSLDLARPSLVGYLTVNVSLICLLAGVLIAVRFIHRRPVGSLISPSGTLTTAAELAQAHDLPLSQARVLLAQGDPAAALALLEPLRRRAQERRWVDEQLSATMLAALAQHAAGESGQAMDMLAEALALAEPGGLLRVFVDEGVPMARLLREALAHGVSPDLVRRLLAAFPVESPPRVGAATAHLAESLTQRELEVLALVAEGLSNQAIAGRLVLSVHTVKVHARNINGKLGVSNRTQAVARARAFGLLSPT
jgi:LuxR family maltose regulon positive regulatory protein